MKVAIIYFYSFVETGSHRNQTTLLCSHSMCVFACSPCHYFPIYFISSNTGSGTSGILLLWFCRSSSAGLLARFRWLLCSCAYELAKLNKLLSSLRRRYAELTRSSGWASVRSVFCVLFDKMHDGLLIWSIHLKEKVMSRVQL